VSLIISRFKVNGAPIKWRHSNSDNHIELEFYSLYFTSRLRKQYRNLRKAGLDTYEARGIIWDVLLAADCGNTKFVSYQDNEK